jgi:hypothetical protein
MKIINERCYERKGRERARIKDKEQKGKERTKENGMLEK